MYNVIIILWLKNEHITLFYQIGAHFLLKSEAIWDSFWVMLSYQWWILWKMFGQVSANHLPKKLLGNPQLGPRWGILKKYFFKYFIFIFIFQIKFSESGVDYRLEDRLLRVGRTVEIIILTIRLFTMHSETYVQKHVK
jgi:hypothetical protein